MLQTKATQLTKLRTLMSYLDLPIETNFLIFQKNHKLLQAIIT